MTLESTRGADHTENAIPARPLVRSLLRGLACRCPNCGRGKLLGGYLRAVPKCSHCAETFDGLHRADDLPPYLTVFVVGHVVVALFMAADEIAPLSMGASLGIFVPLTLLMSLALLRPMKGFTIGLQWSLRMHGFGTGDEAADH